MIRILLIDDETLARSVVRNYLKDCEEAEVVGEASNGFDGLKLIIELSPDLIFLDVQMPKLTGFEMLELLENDKRPAVIFCTAYDEYALKAFEQNAADYLLKPFSRERLLESVRRAKLSLIDTGVTEKVLENSREAAGTIDRVVVRQGSKIIIIPVSEINHVQAEDDYVSIHTKGKKYLKQLTLKYLEEALPQTKFVRIHRSHIVSVDMIDKLEAYSKDSYLAILNNGEKLPVSRTGYQSLRDILGF